MPEDLDFESLHPESERRVIRQLLKSLGNSMSHVARDSQIPDDAGVAIEYRLNARRFRIDFMLSGRDGSGNESL